MRSQIIKNGLQMSISLFEHDRDIKIHVINEIRENGTALSVISLPELMAELAYINGKLDAYKNFLEVLETL